MPNLSLIMIVRNEEKFLEDCLISVKNLVDEIIVIDTGSSDRTVEIAEKYKATIYSFQWINDFAAARNFSLSKATGKWVLYLDADERLDSGSAKEISKIVKTDKKAGYFCTVKSLDSTNNRDNSMRYVRLFRNIEGIGFTGKVHEQISHSLKAKGAELLNSDILINHLGYDVSEEEKKKKASRNLDLLNEEYGKNQTGYLAYQLANSYYIIGDNENSVKFFKIGAESKDLSNSLKADSYSNLALNALKNFNSNLAADYIDKSISLENRLPFPILLKSKIKLQEGEKAESEELCRKAYNLNKNADSAAHKSDLFVFLDYEELIGYGLYLALFNGNGSNLQFYLKEYQSLINKKGNGNRINIVTLVTKLLSKTPLEKGEEEQITGLLSNNNESFFFLLFENALSILTGEFVYSLQGKGINESSYIQLIMKYHFEKNELEKSISIAESNKSIIEKNPSLILLLISTYIMIEELDKGEFWIDILEKKFGSLIQIKEIVQSLRGKILFLKKS